MLKKQKVHIKNGETVKIISGCNKNKIGQIIKVFPKTGKVLVKGINLKFKHCKPNNETEIGEIKQIEAPIDQSNVKLN